MDNILEVKNLTKTYPGFALKNINFTLPKGVVMGFIGENGAGKTTTIKAILDISKNYQGKIKIFGLDNRKAGERIRENLGVVLDDAFFPETLTARNIADIMKDIYKTWDSTLYNKYLTNFSLPDRKPIKKLSKGMLKKLEIITALSHHPKLLILDEPTSGLDPIARSEIIDIFQDFIQDEDCSIFLSSHITSDLEQIADFITFIDRGEILLSKTKDELLDQYGILKCTESEFQKLAQSDYLRYKKSKYSYEVLVENKQKIAKKYGYKTFDKPTLENLMILMLKGEK